MKVYIEHFISAHYSTADSDVPPQGKDAATMMALKMNQTFARTEDDYYKSWILPASKIAAMKMNQIEEGRLKGPAGILFKPDTKPLATETTIVRIISIQNNDGTDEIQKEESWVPARPKYTPSQTKRQNPDDWETWKSKLAKLETEKTTHKQKDSSEKDSIESAWVPPTRRSKKRESGLQSMNVDGNDFRAKFNSSQNSNETSWLPPSRIVRLDFAGSMNSQPTGATKARSSFKDPNDRTRMPSGTDGSGSSSFSSSNSDQSSSNGDDPYVMSGVAREVPLTPSSRSRRESSHTSTDYSSSYSKNSSSEGTEALFENFKGGHPSKQNSNDDISQELENSTRVYSGDQKVFELIDDKRVYSGEQKLFERIDETSESGDGGPRNEQKNYDRTSEGAANATVQVDLDLEKGVDKDASNLDSEKSPTRPRRMMALSIVLPVVIVGTVVGVVLWLVLRNGSSSSPSAAVSPPSFPSRPSSSPIGPPPSVDELRSMIIEASPDVELRFINSNSPQSQALNWLSTNQFLASYPDQRILQRFVLASIYYSTDGRSWNQDDVWLSDIDECDWYSSETLNDVCNSQGVMDEIDLKENGLRGPIDWTSILILGSQLTVLDLAANQLSGRLSMEIRGLSQLLVLNLQDNQMSGTIPSVFGDLRGLRQLDLSNNSLDGNLPTQLASMESLQSLRLNGNQFSGTIPTELGRMTDLRQLFLNDNSFVGSVPTELCSLQLSKLEVDCDIACSCCTSCGPNGGSGGENDDLSGDPFYEVIVSEFPAGAGALNDSGSPQRNALNWLKSPFNNGILADERRLLQRYALATFFYSTVGSRWSSKDSWVSGEDECTWFTSSNEASVCDTDGNIIELSLQQNGLDGSIPPELALLSNSLEIIDLKDNNIAGSIPTEFGQFSRLVRLNLAQNDLFGVIPSEFGQMSSLERLVLFGNNLFSVVPSELGFIRGLQLLDVGDNQLTGTIPSTIGLIESLGGLSIYNNFLSGTIPSQISNLPNLQLFYADDNDLRGPIPVGFCQLDLQEFWTDCEETECTCCTTCCTDSSGCA